MMGLHFKEDVPFRDVYIHALVRDEKGAKMSKSKGNVIDPIVLIDRYGADALRFTLAAMAAQGRDIKLSVGRVEGYRNFATKLWNAARFAQMNGCERRADFSRVGVRAPVNRWILGESASAIAEVTGAIEAYRFNEAAGAVYRFVWNVFCDWYVELAKPALAGADVALRDESRATTAHVLDEIAKLLHPFMPFITEELWAIQSAQGPAREGLLALSPWPDQDEGAIDAQAEEEIGWIVDLVTAVRSARAEMNVPAAAQIPLILVGASAEVVARTRAAEETLRRLARLSSIEVGASAPKNAAQVLARGVVAALPLEGVIDVAAESARLKRDLATAEREAATIDAKLAKPDFVARAPQEVVEENRERRADALARADKLRAALASLSM